MGCVDLFIGEYVGLEHINENQMGCADIFIGEYVSFCVPRRFWLVFIWSPVTVQILKHL